jgi:hypothetical protein
MDCDGFTDLCAFGRGLLTVWTGDGAGNWTQATSVSTPTPGYYQALRTGADFDHNGRPDIVLVSEEGPWPNEQNWAHAYRETTAARALSVFPVFPRGREKFLNGSVQFIDWWSAAPSAESTRVRLELSTTGSNGPWALVADTLRNGGRYQWLVPESVVSGDCYVRYTVTGPGGPVSAVTPRAFVIGDTVVGQAERGPRPAASFGLCPNPAREVAVVSFGTGRARLVLVDAAGRTVLDRRVEGSPFRLGLAGLAPGTYFVGLRQGQTSVWQRLTRSR